MKELSEISKSTLGRYIKKASSDLGKHSTRVATDQEKDPASAKHSFNTVWKRTVGIRKAVDKLTKEEVEVTESKGQSAEELSSHWEDHKKHIIKGDVSKAWAVERSVEKDYGKSTRHAMVQHSYAHLAKHHSKGDKHIDAHSDKVIADTRKAHGIE